MLQFTVSQRVRHNLATEQQKKMRWASFTIQQERICLSVENVHIQSLGREDPLGKEMAPTLVFLPGKSHGQKSLVGYNQFAARV